LRHQIADGGDVVRLCCVASEAVNPFCCAPRAPVHDHQSLARAVIQLHRQHHAAAVRRAISGPDVDVLGPQTQRAVVPVTAIGNWLHFRTAVAAAKTLILG
jgi:hypothetical protein